jgi:cyclopropane fatty-acyl-phospholipid synthase-like methyltransferase
MFSLSYFSEIVILKQKNLQHVGVRRYSAFLAQMYELLADDGLFVFQVAGLRQGWQFEDLVWYTLFLHTSHKYLTATQGTLHE